MNSLWLPNRRFGKVEQFFFETAQEDLDRQASVCSELNLVYTQLSGGRFEGRVSSADLGQTSIYNSHHNQTIEKQVSVPSDCYCFFVLPDGSLPFYAYGVEMTKERVYVLPPGGGSIVVCPANGSVLMFTISRDALIHNDGLIDDASDWFMKLDRRGAVLQSDSLADRLRSDIASALESVGRTKAVEAREVIDRATVFRVSSSFTMEALRSDPFSTFQRPVSFERFWRARKLLLDNLRTAKECGLQSLSGLGSRRSTEQAFSEHVFMGPLAYYRVVRLHSVRRKLMNVGRLGQSIGDIASEEGFWDWSRFSTYYRRHFGELPSETRGRLDAPA